MEYNNIIATLILIAYFFISCATVLAVDRFDRHKRPFYIECDLSDWIVRAEVFNMLALCILVPLTKGEGITKEFTMAVGLIFLLSYTLFRRCRFHLVNDDNALIVDIVKQFTKRMLSIINAKLILLVVVTLLYIHGRLWGQ